MYAFYSLLTGTAMVLLSPYFLVRGMISGKYLRQVAERLGWRFPPELRVGGMSVPGSDAGAGGAIWIHAVSVGEVLAALPLAHELKRRHPERRLIVSTTTTTGQKVARERMHFANAIFYFPLDWQGPVRPLSWQRSPPPSSLWKRRSGRIFCVNAGARTCRSFLSMAGCQSDLFAASVARFPIPEDCCEVF